MKYHCILCKTEYDPNVGQRCPTCGGEIRPIKSEIPKKPRAKK